MTLVEIQNIQKYIGEALAFLDDPDSREMSLVRTKLQEAKMWIQEVAWKYVEK